MSTKLTLCYAFNNISAIHVTISRHSVPLLGQKSASRF
nr:MAG TPA: hypothetical protein [Caudoviricetes sp.]